MNTYLVGIDVLAASAQQGQDLKQNEHDLSVAHERRERGQDRVKVFQRDLANFPVAVSRRDEQSSNFLTDDRPIHRMFED